MYIYFNEFGTLQEIVNVEDIRKGSSDYNHIYVYVDNLPTTYLSAWATFQLPDGTKTNEVQLGGRVEKVIPYSDTRNYKYFKDYTSYNFFDIAISDIALSQSGLVLCTIRIVLNDNSTTTLGVITFNVEDSVILDDNFIQLSQYNYLIEIISRYGAVYNKSVIGTTTQILDGDIVEENDVYSEGRLVISSYNDKFSLFKIVKSGDNLIFDLIASIDLNVNQALYNPHNQERLETITFAGKNYYVKDYDGQIIGLTQSINSLEKGKQGLLTNFVLDDTLDTAILQETLSNILARKEKFYGKDIISVSYTSDNNTNVSFITHEYNSEDNFYYDFKYVKVEETKVHNYLFRIGRDGVIQEKEDIETDLATSGYLPKDFTLSSSEDNTKVIEEIITREDYNGIDKYTYSDGEVETTALTQAMALTDSQWNALNSGITIALVNNLSTNGVNTTYTLNDNRIILGESSKRIKPSNYTIDDLKQVEVIATGSLTQYSLSTLLKYDYVIVFGYKVNLENPNSITFGFIPSTVQTSANQQYVAQAGSSNWEYRIRLTKDSNNIYWWSDLDYSGSNQFIATKLIGFKAVK